MNFTPYGGIEIEPDELRAIIQGKIGFRRCADCQGEGQTWTLHYVLADDFDQDNEQQKDVSAQFAADFDEDNLPPQYSFGECHLYDCETCYTVGYVKTAEL